MDPSTVLIVGSNNKSTGGIPRYIPEQVEHLPDEVETVVYDVGAPRGSGPVWFLTSLLLALVDAAKFPFRSRPDVVHVHSSQYFSFYRSAFYVLVAAWVWRVPVVLHVHGSSFDEFVATESRLSRRVQSLVYRAADEVVVLSAYWRETLAEYVDEDDIRVIPNAVDPDAYDPAFDVDPPHVVFVSDLISRKGVADLLTALDSLRPTGEQGSFRVTIAGKGPLADRVERAADTHSGVEYLGYVSERGKRELLDEGSIFVLPSYAEGLPIAILEAMAGGNAILSTTVGSIPEVVDERSGALVPPGEPDELERELRRLVEAPAEVREMAERNRELVEQRYSWNRVSTELLECYEDLTEPIAPRA